MLLEFLLFSRNHFSFSFFLRFFSVRASHSDFLLFFRLFSRTRASLISAWPLNVNGSHWLFGNGFNNSYFLLLGRRLFFGDNSSTGIVGFGDNIFICKTKVGILSSSSLFCQIVASSITAIKIVISFEPLGKLQIILILSFS